MKPARPALLLLLLALAIWGACGSPATAHGVLERSTPPANTVVAAPPSRVVLWMSEPIDPAFSSIAVADENGRRVERGLQVAGNGRQLLADVGTLRKGAYIVRWRVLSLIDGHTTAGAFLFSVGQPLPEGQARPDVRGVAGSSPALLVVRWVALLAAMLLAGSVFFRAVVLRPAMVSPRPPEAEGGGSARITRAMALTAGAILVGASAAEILLRASELSGLPVLQTVTSGRLWPFIAGTKPGWSFLGRTAVTAVLLLPPSPGGRLFQAVGLGWLIIVGGLLALFGGPSAALGGSHVALVVLAAAVYGLFGFMAALVVPRLPDVRVPALAWVPPAAAVVLLGAFTLAAHASGRGLLAAVADLLHLTAAAVWLGGLVTLLLMLAGAAPAERPALAGALVPRFSRAAGVSLAALVLTGTYGAWLHLPSVRAFGVSAYGRTLLLKLLLVLPWVALGAYSHIVLRARLAGGGAPQTTVRRFRRLVAGEVVLGAAVLMVVTVLTVTPPPGGSAQPEKPLLLAGVAGDAGVQLSLTPALPGWNRYSLAVTWPQGPQPARDDVRIMLRLMKLDQDLPATRLRLVEEEDGRYAAEGGELALPGWWQVEAIIRRRGRMDASAAFPLYLGPTAPGSNDPAAEALLRRAREATGRLKSWREAEALTDGNGGFVFARYELMPPDRLRYRTGGGASGGGTAATTEAIIIGATRYLRQGDGPWERDSLPAPIVVEGPALYLRDAEGATRGRREACDGDECQVVLWRGPGGSPQYAGWISVRTFRVHRLLMAAPAHYMSLRAFDFNQVRQITPPR